MFERNVRRYGTINARPATRSEKGIAMFLRLYFEPLLVHRPREKSGNGKGLYLLLVEVVVYWSCKLRFITRRSWLLSQTII
jgi:hypothetical protein